MSRYINPYTDFGFKKLFGQEADKDILISFLNSVLPERHRIKTLRFRNAEQLGPTAIERKAIFDIFCEAESGEKFIVEMQNAKQHFFKDRALFYAAFPIREQGIPGDDWQFELKAVYFVGILGFEYDEQEERRKFLRDVMLKDQDGDVFYDKLRFIFLQMPLFTKTESELKTNQDKWLYFLKHLAKLEDIPAILREPVFERAFATAEMARLSSDEQFVHMQQQMVLWDNYAVMKTAEMELMEARSKGRREGMLEGKREGVIEGKREGEIEGRREGMLEGKREGETSKALDIARKMKAMGLDTGIISKTTGISIEEIDLLE